MKPEVLIEMARDWANIKRRQACDILGSPEAGELLADAKKFDLVVDALKALSAQAAPSQPAVPMSESQRADMICAVAAICTGTSSRTVAATAIEWTERYYGIATPAASSQPPTDGLIEKGAMTGMVDAQIDDIVAILREKEQAK